MNQEEFIQDIESTGLATIESVTKAFQNESRYVTGEIVGGENCFTFTAIESGWDFVLFENYKDRANQYNAGPELRRLAQHNDVRGYDKAAPIIKDCLQRLVKWRPEKFKRSLTFRKYSEDTPPVDGQYLVMYGNEHGKRASEEAELSNGKWVCPYSGQPLEDAGEYVLYYAELPEYPFQGAIA